MDYELDLSPANRLKLAEAFGRHKRVDLTIDCVLEGQVGHAFVDEPDRPTAYRISCGPFWYLAGDASGAGGRRMLQGLPPYYLLMPAPPEWLQAARELFGEQLQPFTRFSFSSAGLSLAHLEELVQSSRYRERIVALDEVLARRLANEPEPLLEIEAFGSVSAFLARGIGYAAVEGDKVLGLAYPSLACSKGIEVSIWVAERYRQRGIATALGSRLALECLRRGIEPHWDAANGESCGLARKLGYRLLGHYEAYYWEG